jgi:dihydropyrimidinase
MESFDLAIRRGTVVNSGGAAIADIGIRNGKIMQLGGAMSAREEIDARDRLVLPGGIDMHVHLTPVESEEETSTWADDFRSGSRAAAAGGITTLGNMTFPRGRESLAEVIRRVAADAERDSLVDFVLHPVLIDPRPERVAEIPRLAENGHTSVKLFMMLQEFEKNAAGFLDAMASAGVSGVLTMIHCEDPCVIDFATRRLLASGKSDISYFATSRPIVAERVAVARAIALAEAAAAPIYIVHLSSADALDEVRRAQARGLPIFAETRPIYLRFTGTEYASENGALYASFPPLREQRDLDALWAGLGSAAIHTCCTDHAAWTAAEKLDPSPTIETALPGVADLETMMPMLFSDGVRTGRISLSRFVEITATNAAKLFGLHPRKGTIAVGSDADLVIWDPERTRTVHGGAGQSNSGFSLLDGRELTGWPERTISRGETVYVDRRVTAPAGRGRLIRRGRTQRL